MRNADWSKYLDQMEQALQSPAEERRPDPSPKPPVMRIEQAISVAPPVAPKPISIPVMPRETVPRAPVVKSHPSEEPVQTSESPAKSAAVDSPANSGLVQTVRLRKSIPAQLQTPSRDEIAQNSYKGFRETREELLQRLLDPQISLEDAARILNVCPTTVRRYTNRGVLKHIRTAGNQRRFRLSDVLAFMEAQARGEIAE